MHKGKPNWRTRAPRLLAGAAALALGGMFLGLASEITEGETHALDVAVLHAMQALRTASPRTAAMMRDLSGLGSVVVLTLFSVATVAYLALLSRVRRALIVGLSVGVGAAAVVALKAAFGRVRPDAELAAYAAAGLSFPSGHSSMSAVVFLSIGAVLASARRRRAEQVFIVAVAVLATLLVGISRLVLGVHYLTDVLGGWAFGTAWALAWLLVDRAASGGDAGA